MTEQSKHRKDPGWIRVLLWIIGGILILLAIVRLSLKTSYVQNFIKGYALTVANEQLNAQLSVDNLSGDLWREVEVTGLHLEQEDTIAYIDTLYARYNLLSLLGKKFEVSELEIVAPQLHIHQQRGVWNIQDLVQASEDTTVEDTSGTAFPFQIEQVNLHGGEVFVQSDSLPVESQFSIHQLAVNGSLAMDNTIQADINNLSFQVEQTQLNTPLTFESSARADSNSVTLEKLIMASGNSVIRSSAYVGEQDSSVRLNLSTSPLSWKDLSEYAQQLPLRQNLDVDLDLGGTLSNFNLTLSVQGDGLESLEVSTELQWQEGLRLQRLSLDVQSFKPDILLADTTLPEIQRLNLLFTGTAYADRIEESHGEIELSVTGIHSPSFQVDSLSGTLNIEDTSARGSLQAYQNDQSLKADVVAEQVWSDLPHMAAQIEGSSIDPTSWMPTVSYDAELNFTADLNGPGFYPDSSDWNYELQLKNSSLMQQSISEMLLKGEVSTQEATANGYLSYGGGRIDLNATVGSLQTIPRYSFTIHSSNLNVGPLIEGTQITTAINGTATGEGKGFTPASMNLKTTISIDSSLINQEYIRRLSADIGVEDSVMVIDSTRLQSALAEGSLWGHVNILRPYSPQNDLSLEMTLKDISSLAPVFNTDTLKASGTIHGNLNPVADENLLFKGQLDLTQIQYAGYAANQLQGALQLSLQEDVRYQVDLELISPDLSGVQLQELTLFSQGEYQKEGGAKGDIGIEFSSTKEGEIEYVGNYAYSNDSTIVETTELNIISNLRTLTLRNPAVLSISGNSVEMDTLRVASGDSAFVELAIPKMTPSEQQGYLHGENLNLTVIQQALFGDPYFGGLFSGKLEFIRSDSMLTAQGSTVLTDITFNGTHLDSIRLAGNVEDKRLQGSLKVLRGDTVMVDGELNVPFRLEAPDSLPPIFFEQPVNGHLTVHEVSLDRFEQELSSAGIEETDGIFSFYSTLGGTAGEPKMTAEGTLHNAHLSGVAVDSVTAGLQYSHDQSSAAVNASVIANKQEAAQIQAHFPLFLDMKTFEVDLPEKKDTVSVIVQTNDFNLSSLNDFMDPETFSDIKGRVNGEVVIKGPMQDLESNGQLSLEKGELQIIPAGIVVDEVESTFEFFPGSVRLNRFHAESGGGELTANGNISLEELVPGKMNIEVEANNFEAANTGDYQATINLDAKAGGTVTKPEIIGSLTFVSGFIQLDNFGEKSVENIELDTTQQEEPSISTYDSLRMEMEVSFDQRFFVRNERYLEMEIELGGQVDLVKERGEELQLFGALDTEDGYALPLGKRFNLQEGVVTFSGPPGNPELNIRTQYEPPQTEEEIVIWYIIEGTVEDPKFRYESQPPMGLENILSYTLFGQPFYALDSWEQLVTNTGSGNGTTATDVALDVLLERVEAVATKRLGIDVVRIESTRARGENATSVTTGWYLNPKVFFAIQNIITGSSPDTGFLLEYMLRDNLELIIRQGTGIREGVDIKWEYDY